jgi:membrane protease YdiL (CAAX protease family)
MARKSASIASPPAVTAGQSKRVWFVLILFPFAAELVWRVVFVLWRLTGVPLVDVGEPATSLRMWSVVLVEMVGAAWVLWWWHNQGRSLSDLGLSTEWFGRELLLGLATGFLLWVAWMIPWWILNVLGLRLLPAARVIDHVPSWMAALALMAFGEEVIWRGFAISEFHRCYRLSASLLMAVSVYTLFYVDRAIYDGWPLIPWAVYVGGGLSVLYLWRRSLIAPMVAHFVIGCLSGLLAGIHERG